MTKTNLDFYKILDTLKDLAVSEQGKELLGSLTPLHDVKVVRSRLNETTEARRILEKSASIPLHSLQGMKELTAKIEKGLILNPEDFSYVASFQDWSLPRSRKDSKMVVWNSI